MTSSPSASNSLSRMLHEQLLAGDADANRELAEEVAKNLFKPVETVEAAEGNWGDTLREAPKEDGQARCQGFGWKR